MLRMNRPAPETPTVADISPLAALLAEDDALSGRIRELEAQAAAIAGRVAALTAQRTRAVVANAPAAEIMDLSVQLAALEHERAPIADAIQHLRGACDALAPQIQAAQAAERRARARASLATSRDAHVDAIAERDAPIHALAVQWAAREARVAATRAAAIAADVELQRAESPDARDARGNLVALTGAPGVSLYASASVAQFCQMLDQLASVLARDTAPAAGTAPATPAAA